MDITALSDEELINTYGGGYGCNGIVHEVREHLQHPGQAHLFTSAFLVAAKRHGVIYGDTVYVLLSKAVARELRHQQKTVPAEKKLPGAHSFRGEVRRRVVGSLRYDVLDTHGVTISFIRNSAGNLQHLTTIGEADEAYVQAAREYAQEHWK